jgi:hypothetical protein
VPGPPLTHVEPGGKSLLDQLHDLRQLEAVVRLDKKRNLRPAKLQTAQFKPEDLPYFIENLLKQVLVRLRPEQGFSVVYRRMYRVPYALS